MAKPGCIAIVHSLFVRSDSVQLNHGQVAELINSYAGPLDWRIENPQVTTTGPAHQQAVLLRDAIAARCTYTNVIHSPAPLLRDDLRGRGALDTYARIIRERCRDRNLLIVASQVSWHFIVDAVLNAMLDTDAVSWMRQSPANAGTAIVIADFTISRFLQRFAMPNPPLPYDLLPGFLE